MQWWRADDVVQGLVAAKLELEADNTEAALNLVTASLDAARVLADELLASEAEGAPAPGDLRRARPASAGLG